MKYRFLSFELDKERHELRNEGVQVAIPPKAFSVLVYLMDRRDRLVPKAELLDTYWSANVSEAALQTTISLVRKALGGKNAQSVIKTHHGRGLRFVAQVTEIETEVASPQALPAQTALSLREQRFAAVLCVRLKRSEQQLDSEDALGRAIDVFFEAAGEQVDAQQGRLLHMLVDGFTAVFGVGNAHEDSARRAAYCALALASAPCVSQLADMAVSLAVAIDSGPVETAGDQTKFEWSPPSRVERDAIAIAESAPGGTVLLGDATLRQLGDEAVTVASTQGHQLLSVGAQRTGIPARPLSSPSQFVGRSAEVAFLSTSLEGLRAGSGQAFVLSGPAGIGKSRLVAEFLSQLQAQPLETLILEALKLHCLPSLANTPLAPIREMCLALFDGVPEGFLEDEIDQALFDDLLHETATQTPALKGLSDQVRKQRVFALLDRLLRSVCQQHSLVLVVEDVHWVDATSGEYFDALVRQIDQFGLMLIMTTRPSEQRPLAEAVLQLPPLSRSDSLNMLLANPELTDIAKVDAEALVERAAGNPFFLEELALASQTDSQSARNLPDTVQAVISVRVDALDPAARAALYVVAVIGSPASLALVAHLLGQAVEGAGETLERLVFTGFLARTAGGYSFRHMLIHDTAYVMITEPERRHLHKEISNYLTSDDCTEAPRPEMLAFHQQEAGDINEAIESWTLACSAALNRFNFREAIAFATSGLALIDSTLSSTARSELDLQLAIAIARTSLEGYASAGVGEAFYRAQTLNAVAGTPEKSARVNVGLWIHTWVRGELGDSLGYASRLIQMSQQMNNPVLSLQAHASMGEILFHTGQLKLALKHLESGLAFIDIAAPESIPSQNAAVACAAYAAWAASMSGDSGLAAEYFNASATLSRALENPFATAVHLGLCAQYFLIEDDVDACLDLATESVAISRQYDFAFWCGSGLVLRSWALSRRGQHLDARAVFEEGISVFEATGAGVQLANYYGLKAEAFLIADEIEAGLQAAEHALAFADRTNDKFYTPRIHATASLLYERQGKTELAAESARVAKALAVEFGIAERVIQLVLPR